MLVSGDSVTLLLSKGSLMLVNSPSFLTSHPAHPFHHGPHGYPPDNGFDVEPEDDYEDYPPASNVPQSDLSVEDRMVWKWTHIIRDKVMVFHPLCHTVQRQQRQRQHRSLADVHS